MELSEKDRALIGGVQASGYRVTLHDHGFVSLSNSALTALLQAAREEASQGAGEPVAECERRGTFCRLCGYRACLRRTHTATTPAPPDPQARIEALEEAVAGIADDYMTSEKHHPGYVLIPVAKFEQLRRATLQGQQS